MPIPVDLSKLSDVVKNDVVRKDVYDKLVTTVNNIDTSVFVLKTKYDTDKSELENKIPDTRGLVKKTDYNTKITEIEGKIPDITNLATKTADRLATKAELTAIENKIPDVSKFTTKTVLTNLSNMVPDISTLIKKSEYDTKIAEIENKYVSNTGFDSKLVQANVSTKINFDPKIIELENNIKKLQTFDLSYFRGKSHFEEDDVQNYLVFQPIRRYLKKVANTKYISSWRSKGLSDETIKTYDTSDNSLTPLIDHYGSKVRLKFNKGCLKQSNNLTYDYGARVNIYIVYELCASSSNNSDPALKNYLFGEVTLTKNADVEKYGHSGYGIGFDRYEFFC